MYDMLVRVPPLLDVLLYHLSVKLEWPGQVVVSMGLQIRRVLDMEVFEVLFWVRLLLLSIQVGGE